MALTITDNFDLGSKKPIEKRDEFNSISDMKAYSESFLNEGHVSMVNVGTSANPIWKRYEWKSSNANDSTLGRWREFDGGAKLLTGSVNSSGVMTLSDNTVTELKDGLYLLTFAAAIGSSMGSITFNNNTYTLKYRGATTAGLLHNIVLANDSVLFYLSGTVFDFISVNGGNGRQLVAATSEILGGIKIGSVAGWSQWDSDYCYEINGIVSGEFAGHAYVIVPNALNSIYGTVKTSDSTQFTSDVADNAKKDLFVPTLLAVKNYVDNAVGSVSVSAATSSTLGTIKIGFTSTDTERAVSLSSASGSENKAYITLLYASSSHAGIIKLGYTLTDDSTNSVVKYPLNADSYKGYTSIPYADSNTRGVVKLSKYADIAADISNNDDTKAVTPKALNSAVTTVAGTAAENAVNAKIQVMDAASYPASPTADVLYCLYDL